MKVVTAKEMREIERIAIEEYGIPEKLLMAFAGKAVAEISIARFPKAVSAAVVCGTGNNGGDGFVSAYFLHNHGLTVSIYIFGDEAKISGSSRLYLDLCRKTKIEIIHISGKSPSSLDLRAFDFIIDALFGIGLKGRPEGTAAELVGIINFSGRPIVSIDIPSGLPADGEAPTWPAVVRADCTVTMGLPKISLVVWPNLSYCGEVETADIGFPSALLSDSSLKAECINKQLIEPCLANPLLHSDINKGDRGHLLLIGGFDGMEGAIMMSVMAALEAGAGYVSLLTTENARSIIAGKIPELMTMSLQGGNIADILSARQYDAVVIGPGMGRTEMAARIFNETMEVLSSYDNCRVVIDGDGLFHLAALLKKTSGVPEMSYSRHIITPHFLEAGRFIDKSIEAIKSNRLASARECALITGCTVLLKGPASIICSGERSFINTSGNSLLAAAGSGDVLSGFIGAYLLRDVSAFIAACTGCYMHGAAAELLASEGRKHIKATDIVSAMPRLSQTL